MTQDELVDVAEVTRREELAWRETEEAQRLCNAMMELEDRLAEARAAYEQAEVKKKAAWDMVYALFGGSWERHRDWMLRRTK
jgi:hypothetical protein